MTNPVQQAIENRISAHRYVDGPLLDDARILALVEQATRAPSAYNMQNWRFIAVRSQDAKARLQAVAYGQQKVLDAAVAFIVCGTLAAHRQLATALQPSVEAGTLSQRTADAWVAQAIQAHEGDVQLQRDEALRSASLAAMTLMLAAQGEQLGSCAMVGFDALALHQAFGLAPHEVPVLLVTVGYPTADQLPQKPRKPVHEVLEIL
ncbi:nitroreductase family protein [Comamonas sp. JUb58]|uniref:nitroreductase family protein n=1 Tax=Comamonas sp. JUb58 TaxID=2485114 RepID=UPI001060AC74|nr:nitroreductase family protein [Comamonas sp. JUb58]TDS76713.1 nitroreductase [Comamonas sp. JUb58]